MVVTMFKEKEALNNRNGGFVNMGLLRILNPLCSLLSKRNLRSVITIGCVVRLFKMAFAPLRVGLENNTRDVMARQAEGLV